MYHAEKIPEPFRNKPKRSQAIHPVSSIPIEAKEKLPKTSSSKVYRRPFPAILLLLGLFSKKKGDE